MPVAAPANATKGRDIDPISSSCRNNSRNSNGGVTAARNTFQKNIPRSPNHSRNWVIRPLLGSAAGTGTVDGSGTKTGIFAAALTLWSITGLLPNWAPRACY